MKCKYMLDTGKPYIQSKPCRGNKIICLFKNGSLFKSELPISQCNKKNCKFFENHDNKTILE